MQLLRAIGFFYGNMLLLSATIGSGILMSPKEILQQCALNIPVSLSIWAVCGLLSLMNALCQAEMGITFPVSGATYYYLKRSLGSCIAFVSLWIKFFSYSLGLSASSLLIASYLIQPFCAGCPVPELPKKCLALAILWSLGILNVQGIITVSWFNTIGNLIKMAVLCFISVTGVVLLVIGKKENVVKFENALHDQLPDTSGIAKALIYGIYAYLGISVLNNIAGEIKSPAKTIPKSIICTLFMVTLLYLLTNISYLAVLTPQEIISSDSVAIKWMDRVIPSMRWAVSLGISISLLNNISCIILSGSRIYYSASQEGQLPSIYRMLNDHFSPAVAVIHIVILSTTGIIFSNLTYLIKYVGLSSCILNELNVIALLKLRYKEPNLHRPYKVWLPFVFGSMASALFLFVMSVVNSSTTELIYQVFFLFIGLLCYWLYVHLCQHSGFLDTITCYLQLLLDVSPPEDQDKCLYGEEKNE